MADSLRSMDNTASKVSNDPKAYGEDSQAVLRNQRWCHRPLLPLLLLPLPLPALPASASASASALFSMHTDPCCARFYNRLTVRKTPGLALPPVGSGMIDKLKSDNEQRRRSHAREAARQGVTACPRGADRQAAGHGRHVRG